MNKQKVNNIFAYGIFGIGVLKILLSIFIFMQTFTNVNAVFNGGEVSWSNWPLIINLVGVFEIILMLGTIVMIFVNIKTQPELIPWYLLGLGAVALEFVISSGILALLLQCGMYMKAGSSIRKKNMEYKNVVPSNNKKLIKNTDWFYSEQNISNMSNDIKQQKRREKLEKELDEWKELLDSGEIDEETYNQETNKLIEKERRRSQRKY